MKKSIAILILALLIPAVSAQAEEQLAGVTPDSVFYGLDVFFDNVKATLTPSVLGKAVARLDIMEERMAEMEEMVVKNKTTEAKKAELEGRKQIEKFESSVEKIKKKDATELNEHIRTHADTLEILKQRLGDSDWAEAITDSIMMLEELENIIVDIPEDLDPESIFIISSICKEAGAETVAECQEMISSGALTAQVRIKGPDDPPDPHCSGSYSGFYANRKTKWCCDDSDRLYSPEYIEHIMRINPETHPMDNYYYTKGTVEYKIINLKTEEIEEGIETDSCDGDTLTEWLCPMVLDMKTRNERYSEEYECPLGCEDGACIPEEEPEEQELPEGLMPVSATTIARISCEDSDGGGEDMSFIKGEVKYVATHYMRTDYMESDNPEGIIVKDEIYTDSCDGDTLTEWHCIETELLDIEYDCLFGCEDGACIYQKAPEEQELPEDTIPISTPPHITPPIAVGNETVE